MLKCNLAILLAKKGLRVTKVSKDTGISRTTLTALVNNSSKGIQFETIDTLCQYLKTGIADFFEFHPSAYAMRSWSEADGFDHTAFIELTIRYKNLTQCVLLVGFSREISRSALVIEASVAREKSIPDTYSDDRRFAYKIGNRWFAADYYPKLPDVFKTDFDADVKAELIKALEIPESTSVEFNFDVTENG